MDFGKWITILISTCSLLVSGAAFYISLSQSKTDDFKLALETVSEFVNQGSSLPGTPTCFEFLAGADDRLIRTLFARDGFDRALENENSAQFNECIAQSKLTGTDAVELAQQLRIRIMNKLNSYDRALLPVYYNAGMHEPICATIWPSFDEYSDEFLRRVQNMTPRPYLFASETELSAVKHFAITQSCTP